jgi:hypothetical protein
LRVAKSVLAFPRRPTYVPASLRKAGFTRAPQVQIKPDADIAGSFCRVFRAEIEARLKGEQR